MIGIKKTEPKGKASVLYDENQSSNDDFHQQQHLISHSEMILYCWKYLMKIRAEKSGDGYRWFYQVVIFLEMKLHPVRHHLLVDFILSVRFFFQKLIIYVLNDLWFFSHGEPSIFCDNRTRSVRQPKQSKHKEKPQTTESHVEEGVAGDSVGDFQLPNFEYIFNDADDYKFDRHIAALIEMEDAKKLFNDCWNTKNDALKETLSATSQCHLDTKGKSKVVCGDETVSPKFDMNLDNFLIPKNIFRLHKLSKNSHIAYRTRLNVSRKNECVVIDIMKPSENITVKSKREACRSTTVTADVRRKRTVKRLKNNSFLEFTKVAEIKLHLPVDVSSDLSLSVDNLRDVTIQNLRSELTNMNTRAEKSDDGYRFAFTKWSTFLKSNHIRFGATLFFKYVKSSQLLMLTKFVHKTTKKRGRA
ncbi:putative transcription factor B3-Domain family [Helianthus annuus]|nr:putative transcription factor B3-Domain family [Helianthus annuus]